MTFFTHIRRVPSPLLVPCYIGHFPRCLHLDLVVRVHTCLNVEQLRECMVSMLMAQLWPVKFWFEERLPGKHGGCLF
jgi:hypothetical protein